MGSLRPVLGQLQLHLLARRLCGGDCAAIEQICHVPKNTAQRYDFSPKRHNKKLIKLQNNRQKTIPLPKNKQAAPLDSEWRRLVCVWWNVLEVILYDCSCV